MESDVAACQRNSRLSSVDSIFQNAVDKNGNCGSFMANTPPQTPIIPGMRALCNTSRRGSAVGAEPTSITGGDGGGLSKSLRFDLSPVESLQEVARELFLDKWMNYESNKEVLRNRQSLDKEAVPRSLWWHDALDIVGGIGSGAFGLQDIALSFSSSPNAIHETNKYHH